MSLFVSVNAYNLIKSTKGLSKAICRAITNQDTQHAIDSIVDTYRQPRLILENSVLETFSDSITSFLKGLAKTIYDLKNIRHTFISFFHQIMMIRTRKWEQINTVWRLAMQYLMAIGRIAKVVLNRNS